MPPTRVGFIKIDRSLRDHWLWKRRPFSYAQAWIDLLLRAKWADDKEMIGNTFLVLKRGQILTSQVKLSDEWGWDRRSTNKFLSLLKTDRMIHSEVYSTFTVITICNYDTYQSIIVNNAQHDAQDNTQQPVQHHVQQLVHSKESKEDNILTTLVPTKNGDDTVSDSKPQTKPAKKSEVEKKGSPEWYVKSDAIYLANTANMHLMPIKADIIQQIFSKTIAARPDKATAAFISTNPPIASNFKKYSAMLVFYGIAKTFHMLVCTIRPIEGYKVMRTTNVEKAINHARLLVQDDKQPPEKIKDVMDWMFDEKQDPFWRNTVMSIDGFRRHFDKIVAKMEDSIRAREEKIVKPGFTLNHHGTGHED